MKGRQEHDGSRLALVITREAASEHRREGAFPQPGVWASESRASESSPGWASTGTRHFLLQLHFLVGIQDSAISLTRDCENHPMSLRGWAKAIPRSTVGRPGIFSPTSRCQGLPLPRQRHLRAASLITKIKTGCKEWKLTSVSVLNNSQKIKIKWWNILLSQVLGVERSLSGREVQTKSAWEEDSHFQRKILPVAPSSLSTRIWSDLNYLGPLPEHTLVGLAMLTKINSFAPRVI